MFHVTIRHQQIITDSPGLFSPPTEDCGVCLPESKQLNIKIVCVSSLGPCSLCRGNSRPPPPQLEGAEEALPVGTVERTR